MPPLPGDHHPQLVYVSQQGDTSILQRYDVTTGSRQTLLQAQTAETMLLDANVSPDGQWVLLEALLRNQAAIQLVRVDGQQLQTLYCAPAQAGIDVALLSPDQRSLVFNQEDENQISTLYLLDMTTGKLRTELSPLQPNYPEITQGLRQTTLMSEHAPTSSYDKTTGNLKTHPFTPLPSKHYLIYVPMKWVSNNSVYLFGMLRASGAPLHQLALLRDISKDVTQQQSNLQLISPAGEDFGCRDDDVTPDNSQGVCTAYAFVGPVSPPNAIKMWSITGGALRTVYQGPPGGEDRCARSLQLHPHLPS